jgi:hypothetical protein
MKDKIVQQVVSKYTERSDRGYQKYGTTLEENNRDSYLKHLQEELMDATLYIEKLITLEQEMKRLSMRYPNNQDLGEAVRKLVS